jgi:hypothetical protein
MLPCILLVLWLKTYQIASNQSDAVAIQTVTKEQCSDLSGRGKDVRFQRHAART